MTLLNELHFWSCLDDILVKHTDYGTYKYYNKKDSADNLHAKSKKGYCVQRGVCWQPSNKRPFKLRERLKELEEHLCGSKVVSSCWGENKVYLILAKGILIDIDVNLSTSDITNISFDKSLMNKIQNEFLCSATQVGQQIACICSDGRVFCQGGIWRDGWTIEGGSKRQVSLHEELVALWGRNNSEQPQPWSPLAKDHQRANLNLYWVGSRGPELLAYKKTEGEPIEIIVSKHWNKTLIVVEQKVSNRGAVSVEVSTLELVANNLKRSTVTSVPLQTQVSCCAISYSEDRVLLGCIDRSLALLDRTRGSTMTVKVSFIPTMAVWHPSGVVATISNEKGQIQHYDTALTCVKSQLTTDDSIPVGLVDLSIYFNVQQKLLSLVWGARDLLIIFEQGPLVSVKHFDSNLSALALAQRYLSTDKVESAINLLLSQKWNAECFLVLQRIVTYLMKQALTESVAQHLQNALGSFHSPAVPLSTELRHRYGSQVRAMTRRFFHQLVRYEYFETAFLLAVDIGHHDLFMDLYYSAVRIGEREMAAAARAQASALLSRCSSEDSCCSRSSCSQCSNSESCSDECSSPDSKEVQTRDSTGDYLTTNFNNITPKTYGKPSVTIPSLDLPKVAINPKPKPLPAVVVSKANTTPINTPPLPNLTSTPLQLGIPYTSSPSRSVSTPSLSFSNFSRLSSDFIPLHNFPASISQHYSTSQHFLNSPPPFSPQTLASKFTIPSRPIKNLAPPLPVAPPLIPQTSNFTPPQQVSSKKPQAKVKFSDTVTAFIVPEVKRPVRPPPPPHITDPQKELADSLPLCHPNEDYLKDFTPIRRGEQEEAPAQSKIKVVHFGVV